MLPASRYVFKRLCLWTIFYLGHGGVYAKKQDESSSITSIHGARCASRCLNLHSAGIATLTTHAQVDGALGWCQNHRQCAKCLEPCKDSWELKSKQSWCREQCERSFPRRHWECQTSCEFRRSVAAAKQGECPPPERASGFAAACVESCAEDGECHAQKKCCPNGCGHTCQPPRHPYEGAPLKPRKELVFRELPDGPLEVRWSSRFSVSAEPVVYVLQRRWNHGIHPTEDTTSPWEQVAQTTEERVRLSDTRAGRWYQFRVAAVNIHGTRGFTTPSRHVISSRDPSRPPALRDLRVANVTSGPGGTASAGLFWSAPADPDLPVHHVRVSWSRTPGAEGGASSSSSAAAATPPDTKRRKTVRGQHHVDLDGLRAGSSYSVEVQAVSYWGQIPLRSPKTRLHFSTRAGPPADAVGVGTPAFQDGQLQVRVYWQSSPGPSAGRYRVQWVPEYCRHNQTRPMEKVVTQESSVSLQGLLFDCQYKVHLLPLGSRGQQGGAKSASFLTPPCAAIQDKSPATPVTCPGDQVGAAPPEVLSKAENLTASFLAHRGNVTALFSWEVAPPRPPQTLTGFQVTWADVTPPSSRHHGSPPNRLISQSQILPPERSALVVLGLRLGATYRLEVQVIASGGEGPVTSQTFHTPVAPPVMQHRPSLRKQHHQHQPIIERH